MLGMTRERLLREMSSAEISLWAAELGIRAKEQEEAQKRSRRGGGRFGN
jgi:hypothetical protein